MKGNPLLSPAPTIRHQLEALTGKGMERMGDLEGSYRICCIGCSSSMTLNLADHGGPAAAGYPRALLFDDQELRLPFLCLSHLAPMGIGVEAGVLIEVVEQHPVEDSPFGMSRTVKSCHSRSFSSRNRPDRTQPTLCPYMLCLSWRTK